MVAFLLSHQAHFLSWPGKTFSSFWQDCFKVARDVYYIFMMLSHGRIRDYLAWQISAKSRVWAMHCIENAIHHRLTRLPCGGTNSKILVTNIRVWEASDGAQALPTLTTEDTDSKKPSRGSRASMQQTKARSTCALRCRACIVVQTAYRA